MKIDTVTYIRALRGTYKTTDLVMQEYEGETVARAKVTPENPQTADQVKIRSCVTVATRSWHNTTEAQRDAWGTYSEKYDPDADSDKSVKSLALRSFIRANIVRQILGLPLVLDPPSLGPPGMPTAVRQLGAQSPDSIGLEVDHTETDTAGLMLLVRASDAMNSTACTPTPEDMRYVCGVGTNSFKPLGVSGAPVEFNPTKYVVNNGERYGVSVQIVRTADGSVSAPLYGDFIKEV